MHSSNAVCSLLVICIDAVENKQSSIFGFEQLHIFLIRILKSIDTYENLAHSNEGACVRDLIGGRDGDLRKTLTVYEILEDVSILPPANHWG